MLVIDINAIDFKLSLHEDDQHQSTVSSEFSRLQYQLQGSTYHNVVFLIMEPECIGLVDTSTLQKIM